MASAKGNPVHGWVVLDKPAGITSSRAVGAVRRVFQAAKAGHGGTLDPLATGVLPIALGEASKTVSFVMGGAKSYEFTLNFGVQTTTDDTEGEPVHESDVIPQAEAIERALPQFTGDIEQRPPMFSAIKLDGVRAYDIARAMVKGGRTDLPEMEPRRVRVDAFTLVEADGERARFHVRCGKGTYIRSLARDVALALGSAGHVGALRRLRVGPFLAEDSISLDILEKLAHSAAAFEHLKSVSSALADIPALPVSAGEAARLRHGQTLPALGPSATTRFGEVMSATVGVALSGEIPVALVHVQAGELKPLRVFNL